MCYYHKAVFINKLLLLVIIRIFMKKIMAMIMKKIQTNFIQLNFSYDN